MTTPQPEPSPDPGHRPVSRLAMFREIYDIAVERFGVDGAVTRHLAREIASIEAELENKHEIKEIKFEKGAVLFIAVGAVVLIALMGFSSILIAMMAVKEGY